LKNIIIIGAGPSGLMAAEHLLKKGYKVSLYDHKTAAARKFLVAGHGGFNLTHAMPYHQMLQEYVPKDLLTHISSYTNKDTIQWLHNMGISTFEGSSGKIFPEKHIKPIHVLQAWLNKLQALGLNIYYEYKLIDFNNDTVSIQHKNKTIETLTFDKLILALGGSSWKKTGSDGKWIQLFESKDIAITPLIASNCGYETASNLHDLEGKVLKNIAIHTNHIYKKGEITFTQYGIEGSPIYYLNRFIHPSHLPKTIYIDLKPSVSQEKIESQLLHSKKIADALKIKIKINDTAFNLLKKLPKKIYTHPSALSKNIKAYPITILNVRPIDEAISTAGGVSWAALNNDLSLKQYNNVYCIGEMLDWDAPTGGFLLQACFSLGYKVAQYI
jgi:uncharacterized flavoprotein (TIGR03862 family)